MYKGKIAARTAGITMNRWAFCFLFLPLLAFSEMKPGFGAAVSASAHQSANTILLSTGPEVFCSLVFDPSLEIRAYFHAGTFIGYDFSGGADALYRFPVGPWSPGVGAGVSVSYASPLFSTTNTGYYLPRNPGCGAFFIVDPLCFRTDTAACSFLEVRIGVDLVNFGNIYLLDLTLFRLTIY
jgi:hypothetical protein